MCLDTVDLKPSRRWGVGYKVMDRIKKEHILFFCGKDRLDYKVMVRKGNGVYFSLFYGKDEFRLTDGWKRDTNQEKCYGGLYSYLSGYHLFPNPEDARDYKRQVSPQITPISLAIVKVRFRKVVATGEKDSMKVVVAREIKLIEEVK